MENQQASRAEKDYKEQRDKFADMLVSFLMTSQFKLNQHQAKTVVSKFLQSNERNVLLKMNLEDLNDYSEELHAMEMNLSK
mmetsp:Transcript_9318/g.15710  ORF Transcript_9318/g.15710 Transcript_9318/m.15710 type:complete len:81 (+) Transcript_9318:36-278(+)